MASNTLFKMTVDLNVLDHLADGLYSSVSAVLTETVANAWDADAKEVRIYIDLENDSIVISDNGLGMNTEEVNERYLKVGYRRRQNDGDTSPSGRPVMGRKGIGKLSLMSIANVINVYTKKEDTEGIGLRIEVSKLRDAMKSNSPEYNPDPIDNEDISKKINEKHGTRIELNEIKRDRIGDLNPDSLKRRLARRFSVIGSEEFEVFVNSERVTSSDREDLKFVEYIWIFGDYEPPSTTSIKKMIKLNDRDESWLPEWKVSGWIGTVDKPKRLATPEGNLNSLVVLARGRLVQEDILPKIAGAEVYTKYLTGQIEADFLDDSSLEDIITSNRQSFREDDKRVTILINFLKRSLRNIADEWSNLRSKDKTNELKELYPKINDWLDSLNTGWRDKAETLLQRIATMELNSSNNDEDRKTLLRHSILGFERLRLKGNAEEIDIALQKGPEELIKVLADRDDLEASYYRDIVKSRLEVIRQFENLCNNNEIEKILQEYLYEHLWLLDPSWERAAGSETMEERIRLKNKIFQDDEDTKEKYGRIDIRYKKLSGKHVIIELKRASIRPQIYQLTEQGSKYLDALKDIVKEEPVEVVFIVGKEPNESSHRIEKALESISPGSRLITYEKLIQNAKQAYADFIEKTKEIDKIENILSSF